YLYYTRQEILVKLKNPIRKCPLLEPVEKNFRINGLDRVQRSSCGIAGANQRMVMVATAEQ
ncbi:MAG TPA: hypothetical protein VNW97_16770, partial [Candidatus Saccharimonadales bacterium]|nr:hypothetical protein [Candidatus Saccharimonadales bacterium]